MQEPTEWEQATQSDLPPHFLKPLLTNLLADLDVGGGTLLLTIISLKEGVLE